MIDIFFRFLLAFLRSINDFIPTFFIIRFVNGVLALGHPGLHSTMLVTQRAISYRMSNPYFLSRLKHISHLNCAYSSSWRPHRSFRSILYIPEILNVFFQHQTNNSYCIKGLFTLYVYLNYMQIRAFLRQQR